jgi:precorrin-6Y C5,15-methyltransferase (decarboxylating)
VPAAADPFTVTVVGIGEDGWGGLGEPARAVLGSADVVLGGRRQLDLVAGRVRAVEAWPRDLVAAVTRLPVTHAGRRVVVLASGDPMHFGIGATLVRALGADRVAVLPAPSSVSLACARLGWSVQDTAVVSTVGRPYEAILPELRPGARLLVLTGDADGAARVGRLVAGRGLGGELTVLERLGGPRERISEHPVGGRTDGGGTALDALRHDRLTVVALRCEPGMSAAARAAAVPGTRFPGLADAAFATDGVLTKREVRAVTLAALAPLPGELLWDVGAGSGSVTAEWLRADRRCRAIAIEPRAERAAFIRTNAARLGGAVASDADPDADADADPTRAAATLRIVEGAAPGALAGLPTPDAVFVGGGAAVPGVLEACLAAVAGGGRLVVNAVTLETETVLATWYARLGGELRRIEISRAEPIGSRHAFRPARPVTQWVHTVGAKR